MFKAWEETLMFAFMSEDKSIEEKCNNLIVKALERRAYIHSDGTLTQSGLEYGKVVFTHEYGVETVEDVERILTELKLKMEVVPVTNWGQSLYQLVPRSVWQKLRKEQLEACGNRCEICGAAPPPSLEAHERWEYDETNKVQRLSGIMMICKKCHMVKHYGRTRKLSPLEDIEEVDEHFQNVNGCTWRIFHMHFVRSYDDWERRSKEGWTVNFGPHSHLVKVAKRE